MVYFTTSFTQDRSSHPVTMVDGLKNFIKKTEFLEVSHTDFYGHVTVINNIVSEDKLELLAEFQIFSSTKASVTEIGLFFNEKFGKIFTANTK